MDLTFAELANSPIGPISFLAGDQGVKRISFSYLDVLKRDLGMAQSRPSLTGFTILSHLLVEVNEYLSGLRKTFSTLIDWEVMGSFQRRVLEYTYQIPFGEVMTYGEIARAIGEPGAARAVGRVLATNPIPIVIPCHRVIGSDKELRGYAGGIEAKAFLLRLEGHHIGEDRWVIH